MTAWSTPVTLGGYALILLVVLAAGFGLGRVTADPAPARQVPAPHGEPAPHAQHTEEQS